MTQRLPHKDVVIVGLGWTGSIVAQRAERLPAWRSWPSSAAPGATRATSYAPNYAQDELRYRIRHELFLRPEQTTFTFRNKMTQTALPIRNWGAFMPPNGVGGGGVHWNARDLALPAVRFRAEEPSDAALRRPVPARRT